MWSYNNEVYSLFSLLVVWGTVISFARFFYAHWLTGIFIEYNSEFKYRKVLIREFIFNSDIVSLIL